MRQIHHQSEIDYKNERHLQMEYLKLGGIERRGGGLTEIDQKQWTLFMNGPLVDD